jgi:ADP-heptose:LPS heptosyltransferase
MTSHQPLAPTLSFRYYESGWIFEMLSDSQNILVTHIAGLAQTTLALPALRSLRNHLPNSRINIVSGAIAADLLKLARCADEILPVARFRHSEFLDPRALYRSAKVWGELRRISYDLAIEFYAGAESEIVMRLANPRSRLNRPTNKPLAVVIERVTQALLRQPPKLIHAAHHYLKLLEPLGVRPIESEPRLATDRASDESIDRLLRKHAVGIGELLIGIHPGAGVGRERWPRSRFASIAARMIHNFDARVIVLAGPAERGAARRLVAELPAKRAIAIESLKLTDFASAAARLSLLVTNHSGPAHVAAATGTPVVAVSTTAGPSSHDLLGEHHEHIRGSHVDLISEEAVYDAACRLLKMNRAELLRSR